MLFVLFQLIPLLRTIYNTQCSRFQHMYMALIVLLILTEDQLFNKTVHSIILKGITWYEERVVSEISLGGLIILVTTRTAQYNLLKMRVSNNFLLFKKNNNVSYLFLG